MARRLLYEPAMMKTSNLLASLVFLAMTSTALADPAANGVSLNGWSNGVSLNGWANGVSLNGWTNGVSLNGWQNGVSLNGWQNGVSANGITQNGWTNGITQNGFGVQNASQTRPAVVLSGVQSGAKTSDHQVHLVGIHLKKH
jgi:hypothetical protein